MNTWTTLAGTRIAYRRAGQGPGTILVHGGFIDGSSMTGLMEELASSRTAFAPDRRGHGASSPYDGPHSFDDDVSDLVGFSQYVVDELGEAVELVAHSAGCHIALAAAALAPVSRVVLWEPPDFNAKRVSPAVWQKLEGAAAKGKRRTVVRLLLNEVVGANTGMHIPWFVFPVLFRSRFGKMLLANALSSPTELRALEAHEWHASNLTPAALRQLRKLDPPARRLMQVAIELLSDEPRPNGAKKPVGGEGEWRARTGDYRIIDEVHNNVLLVLVLAVGHRRDIYPRR